MGHFQILEQYRRGLKSPANSKSLLKKTETAFSSVTKTIKIINHLPMTMFYVHPVTGNDAANGSRFTPFKTLTRALKSPGAMTIQLAPGIYDTASGEVFPLVINALTIVVGNEATKGKGIAIVGSGEYHSPTFGRQNITLTLLGQAFLSGVTVTNRQARGTGVWIESASPTLANNTFIDCGREGVFVCGTSKPEILHNLFEQNAVAGLLMAGQSRGKVRQNVFQETGFGMAISDTATPLIVDNKFMANQAGVVLSRSARPILRQNLIENNKVGMVVNGNALPDLGNHEAAGNIFREHSIDLQNLTSLNLISVGNQIDPLRVEGAVNFRVVTVGEANELIDLAGHWAADFVQALVSQGMFEISGRCFQPDAPITRLEYATLIVKAFKPQIQGAATTFIDIPAQTSAERVIQQAVSGGFVSGFADRTFRPQQPVLRLQAIVSLVNGLALPIADVSSIKRYTDRDSIPVAARTAVATATAHNIVVNYPNPQLIQPQHQAKRAVVAVMVYQALVALGRESAIKSIYVI